MQRYSTLSDAIALAEFAHRNQFDKAGLPYIDHPKRVLAGVQAMGALPYVQIAAILHDVTEDTAFTYGALVELGVPEASVRLIRLLDRHDSKDRYQSDLWQQAQIYKIMSVDEFYYDGIKNNPSAKMIKLADIADNTLPWRLSYLEPETQERLLEKYAKARELIGV